MANDTMRLSYRLDLRSLSITLLGTNNRTLTGTVNLSATSDVARQESTASDDYDDSGAAYYVCAVILVYGLSIVSLIGSLAKKKMKDNKGEQEEVQVSRYLNNVPDLREETARDNYRQLKKSVIKLVEEKSSPAVTPQASASSSELKKPLPTSSAKQGKSSIELRQSTPRHYKGKGQCKNGQRRPESQSLLSDDNVEEYEESPHVDNVEVLHALHHQEVNGARAGQSMQRLAVTRHGLLHDEEEEKITVVKTEPKTMQDDPNILLRPSDSQTEPRFRWSLGDDGNIWIMQVDSRGGTKVADPPIVDTLPSPPSPGYESSRADFAGGVRSTTFGVEDECRAPDLHPKSVSSEMNNASQSADQCAVPLLRDLRQSRHQARVEPPKPRYGPRLSPTRPTSSRSASPLGSISRGRSHTPSPRPSSDGSAHGEELMQVTCV